MKPPTIIGTTSFSASGGSAITNILEEFSSIKTLKGGAEFECKFFAENIFALEMAIKNNYDIDKTIKLFIQNAKRISFDSFYEQNFSTNVVQCRDQPAIFKCAGAAGQRDDLVPDHLLVKVG